MSLQRTLLQTVQSVLGAMDSDAIDTIGETPESEQIVLICEEVYLEMATYQDIPQFRRVDQLLGLNEDTRASVMQIPDPVTDIKSVRYRIRQNDGSGKLVEMIECTPDEFLDMVLCWDVTSDPVKYGTTVLESGIEIPYRRDRGPRYWTTFDDKMIVMDGVDQVNGTENTLHNAASMCLSYSIPQFRREDDFVIPLPDQMQMQFLAQVKNVAFYEQKQMPNALQSEKAQMMRRRNQHFLSINDGLNDGEGPPGGGFGKPTHGRYGRSRSRYFAGVGYVRGHR